jgi:hypothetical protein
MWAENTKQFGISNGVLFQSTCQVKTGGGKTEACHQQRSEFKICLAPQSSPMRKWIPKSYWPYAAPILFAVFERSSSLFPFGLHVLVILYTSDRASRLLGCSPPSKRECVASEMHNQGMIGSPISVLADVPTSSHLHHRAGHGRAACNSAGLWIAYEESTLGIRIPCRARLAQRTCHGMLKPICATGG